MAEAARHTRLPQLRRCGCVVCGTVPGIPWKNRSRTGPCLRRAGGQVGRWELPPSQAGRRSVCSTFHVSVGLVEESLLVLHVEAQTLALGVWLAHFRQL